MSARDNMAHHHQLQQQMEEQQAQDLTGLSRSVNTLKHAADDIYDELKEQEVELMVVVMEEEKGLLMCCARWTRNAFHWR